MGRVKGQTSGVEISYPLKVGIRYIGMDKGLKYCEIENKDGWVDVERYLPVGFDLVLCRLSNDTTVCGWHTGYIWDGYKMQEGDIVKYWKRRENEI